MSETFDLILNTKRRKDWDRVLVEGKTVAEIDACNDVQHMVFADGPKSVRDFSLLRSWRRHPTRCVVASRSVVHASVPATEKYERGEVLSSGFIVEAAGGKASRILGGIGGGKKKNNKKKAEAKCRVTYIVQLGPSALRLGIGAITGRSKLVLENLQRLASALRRDRGEE